MLTAGGVNIDEIAPGYIQTDNTKTLQDNPERNNAILKRNPDGRWDEPEDFDGPVVFLTLQASDYMSGATMLVNGSWIGR